MTLLLMFISFSGHIEGLVTIIVPHTAMMETKIKWDAYLPYVMKDIGLSFYLSFISLTIDYQVS